MALVDDDDADNERCRRLCVHRVLRNGLVHKAPIDDAPADGNDDNDDRRGGGSPSSPTRSTTTSRRWQTTACCVWGVDPSTSTNVDADASTTLIPLPPPHRREHPIGIPRPWPHRAAAGGRGGRICDCLREADPRVDVVQGGVHGDWPNLVRGCGADGTCRGERVFHSDEPNPRHALSTPSWSWGGCSRSMP